MRSFEWIGLVPVGKLQRLELLENRVRWTMEADPIANVAQLLSFQAELVS